MSRTSDPSPKSFAEELDCSERHVWNLISEGQLETYQVGRLRRIFRTSANDYKERNRVEPRGTA
ncbi:helix-turn-helix domain-containing protein [Ruegeria arenilitoris]|uniref:helix-turn-helix domain-containing protein n=1 Tax=Ruegeria arenilitoris TaxID=1173585 RepID=UPI00147EC8F2|nr:helix-turn-helix domain-containing protein [Ruegeria arenilitoris]